MLLLYISKFGCTSWWSFPDNDERMLNFAINWCWLDSGGWSDPLASTCLIEGQTDKSLLFPFQPLFNGCFDQEGNFSSLLDQSMACITHTKLTPRHQISTFARTFIILGRVRFPSFAMSWFVDSTCFEPRAKDTILSELWRRLNGKSEFSCSIQWQSMKGGLGDHCIEWQKHLVTR